MTMKFLFSFFFLPFNIFNYLNASEITEFPVLYEGRYRPAQAYAELYEQNNSPSSSNSPLDMLWAKELSVAAPESNQTVYNQVLRLEFQKIPPNRIAETLEHSFPLRERLKNAGDLFLVLPSSYNTDNWLPLNALNLQVYDPKTQTMEEVSNFTLYTTEQFNAIRAAYKELQKAFSENNHPKMQIAKQNLAHSLHAAYRSIAGTEAQKANRKQTLYPTLLQLKFERLYINYPWTSLLFFLYSLASIALLLSLVFSLRIYSTALFFLFFAFIIHTCVIAMRCFILERPPVTNIFETLLYVPWIATAAAIFFHFFKKSAPLLLAASMTSLCLLIIPEFTPQQQNLDPLQAVLDSQFWLLVHVLLVVGSYGIFILSALLAHMYLISFLFNQRYSGNSMNAQMILKTMYLGTTLLIAGTVLGGIWAAESWGRFWDWDPKESWAFISSCIYLIWIHAYRFKIIGSFGLAVGAITGFLAISFTWYGVNYILGTGLHSYGFGTGGIEAYYMFLGCECLFVVTSLLKKLIKKDKITHHP